MATKLRNLLTGLSACKDAIDWIGDRTPEEAWNDCQRGDWMLWCAVKLRVDHKLIVLAACDCAALALPYGADGEDRPRKAIETARAWVRGEATIKEARKAAVAAYAAANAAYAACANAACAAANAACAAASDAAAYANNAAYAADANAAYAAAYAAANAASAAAYAASAAAETETLSECADIVRRHIPWETIRGVRARTMTRTKAGAR